MAARPGFTTLFPYLVVKDAPAYIEFLLGGLGGVEIDRVVFDGRVANAQIRFADTTIMLSEGSEEFPPTTGHFYFFVDDADAAMARALAHGATLVGAVEDKPYGDRQGGVADPAGNIWWISTPLAEGPYATETAT